jgi:hypothetical protein
MVSLQNAQEEMANHARRLTITAVLKAAHSLASGGAVGGRGGESGGDGGARGGDDVASAAAWRRRIAMSCPGPIGGCPMATTPKMFQIAPAGEIESTV